MRPRSPDTERLLAGLTLEQAQAVTHGRGPLLLLAGPGAGKTKTLTHRVAYLLATRIARAPDVLAVTFSVRAAGELRLRLAELLGEEFARGVTAATFHSVCARLLREHAGAFGRTERYTIYDQGDMPHVVERLFSDTERDPIQRAVKEYGQSASVEVLAELSRGKNLLLSPESYERSATHPAAPLIAAVWRESEDELRRSNAFEFGDLLACAVRLLSQHPQRLQWRRQRWRWLIVDEFQDTSHAQAVLVDLLAGPGGNLCVVGDDDQLIHGWRHADPSHILDFAERHPGPTTIVLGRNFRSRAEILEAAVRCVSHNDQCTANALIAMRGPGGQVRIGGLLNEYQEAHWVTGRIVRALSDGTPPAEILVLARTGYATEPLQRALAHAGIAHRMLGSLGLYERAEVRDALAYLALLQKPRDARAFARAIGSPRRGIGSVTVTHLVTWAREQYAGDLLRRAQARRRRRGIGAYLYTALQPVVLPLGPEDRQVQVVPGRGGEDGLALSAATEEWLREGYARQMNTVAARRDLGQVLSHGEPGCGMGQGEVDEEEATRPPGEAFWNGELPAEPVNSGDERVREASESSPGEGGSTHNGVVHVDFSGRGPEAA